MSLLPIFSMEGGRLYTGYHKLEIKNCPLLFSQRWPNLYQPAQDFCFGRSTYRICFKACRAKTQHPLHPPPVHLQHLPPTQALLAVQHFQHPPPVQSTTTITAPTTTGSTSSTALTPSVRLATPRDSDEEGMFLNSLYVFVKKRSLLLL